jgi:hypothetical protein
MFVGADELTLDVGAQARTAHAHGAPNFHPAQLAGIEQPANGAR